MTFVLRGAPLKDPRIGRTNVKQKLHRFRDAAFFSFLQGDGIGNRTAHRTRAGRVIQEPRGPDRSGSHPKTARDRSRSDLRAPPFAKSFISFNHERLETRLFRARGNFPAFPGEALLKAFGNQMEVASRKKTSLGNEGTDVMMSSVPPQEVKSG